MAVSVLFVAVKIATKRTIKEGDPKVKDFKGSSFFVWITPDGHRERMNA